MSRAFCFTANNWTQETKDQIANSGYSYCIYGEEIGENGTRHLQGYIEFTNQIRITTLAKKIKGVHFELRKGTQQQAIDYCKKGEQDHLEWELCGTKGENYGKNAIITESGKRFVSKQGERNDIKNLKRIAITEGMRGITMMAQNAGDIKIAEKYLEFNDNKREWRPTITWIWGAPRIGKSKVAREILGNDNENIYCKNTGTKWWNGYDGHSKVIIDDFRDSWWCITYMLGLLDRYSFKIECKGGEREFKAREIVITSIHPPDSMYQGCRGTEPVEQLLGRLTEIIELKGEPAIDSKPIRRVMWV